MEPLTNSILKGPFWPEPVKTITFKQVGANFILEVVGTKTNTFHQKILTKEDLEKIEIFKESRADFGGNAEAFFLAIESWRIRFAYQFDPLYAVNVSQIDPLPHQIEAVYHYILKNPSIRFLLLRLNN